MSEDEPVVYYNWKQSVVLIVVQKISSALSLVGSSGIICEIVGDYRRDGGGDVIKNILLSMSITDLVASTAFFLSTWPIRKESSSAPFAYGNEFTCTVQGFLMQFMVGAPMYSAIMSIVFLLRVRHGWREQCVRRIAPYLHAFVLTFTIGTAIAGLPLTLYNTNGYFCHICKYPENCNETWEYGTTDCIRGDNATMYYFLFTVAPVWISFIVVVISMVLLCCFVYKTETERRRKWSFRFRRSSSNRGFQPPPSLGSLLERRQWSSLLSLTGGGGSQRRSKLKKTKEAVTQALLYITCFLVVFTPSSINSIVFYAFGFWTFWIDLLSNLCVPAQGFLNFLVFTRKRKRMHGFVGRGFRYLFFKRSVSRVDHHAGDGDADGDDEGEDQNEIRYLDEDESEKRRTNGDRDQYGRKELEMAKYEDHLGCDCDDRGYHDNNTEIKSTTTS